MQFDRIDIAIAIDKYLPLGHMVVEKEARGYENLLIGLKSGKTPMSFHDVRIRCGLGFRKCRLL